MIGKGRCGAVLGILMVALLACGCGEQDLYKPPHSEYQVLARVPLPSAAEDVSVLGNSAYVAAGQAGLIVVDITNPAAPVVRGTVDTHKFAESVRVTSLPTTTGVDDIAFVVEGTEGITTYNVSDPDSAYSFQQGTTAVDGNGLFIEVPEDPSEPYVVYLAENWKGMRIFESDPTVPGLLRYNGVFTGTRGYAKSIAVKDGYAYVADDELGVAVVDVRVRVLGIVRVVASADTPGFARGIAVSGDYAYVADGTNGLVVMAIQGGQTPAIVGQLPLSGFARAIEFRDGKVFVAAQDGGLSIVDVGDPTHPVLLGNVVSPYATGVALSTAGVVVVSDRTEGLLVLGGGSAFTDQTAPGKVTDLAGSAVDSSSVRLSWTAPGDDLFFGTAAAYDVRYSASGVTEETWDLATQAGDEPAPLHAGTTQSFIVRGLESGVEYHFALRAQDEAGHVAGLSNVAIASPATGNVPPTLSGGGVSPEVGEPGANFVFEVTYADPEGQNPSVAEIVLDGVVHAMTYVSGDPVEGALYRYQEVLELGSHEFFFRFQDGPNPPVSTPTFPGPYVGESFVMGSPVNELGRDADETQHTVVLTRSIQVEDHEVTQAEYQELMGVNPSRQVGPDRPVENVTWLDAIAYCNARSVRDGLAPAYVIDGGEVSWDSEAAGWRLPTEAEWERACRAGTATAFANGAITVATCADSSSGQPDPVLTQIGWYCGNANSSHHDVRTKLANAGGLYDMHGNVWEWCWDWYVADLGSAVAIDPAGPQGGSQRVIRGGSWYYFARDCRSAARAPYWPNSKDDIVGFRVVRTSP
jgi:formylglycine-generating enzyme required for sulfatase activity